MLFELHVERIAENVASEALVVVDVEEFAIEKHQPTAMTPQEVHQRTVRIGSIVGVLVMDAVHRNPAGGGVLHGADAQDRERVFQPLRTGETLMGEQSVIAKVDPQRAEHVEAKNREHDARPTEEVRKERQAREHMHGGNTNRIPPADLDRIDCRFGPMEFVSTRVFNSKRGDKLFVGSGLGFFNNSIGGHGWGSTNRWAKAANFPT